MSDTLRVQPFDALLTWMLTELQACDSIMGIPRSLFYRPMANALFSLDDLYGHPLATPIGPAAGPHTQLAQNIVCAWLSGGRFIELKTVQIMDRLEIPRPCIDAADEGYNVEWSQELTLEESAREYIHAWVLIHILRRVLGLEHLPLGTIFNMSVGYSLEGIRQPPMLRFMDRLADASAEIDEIQSQLRSRFPQFADIEIPAQVTNNVTLSTMHGCPPDEIEAIARFLLEERGLHTTVKLNPTLLGQDAVLRILHDHLGYREIDIPDSVFAHDLQYDRAVALIRSLQAAARSRGRTFAVKLSNTLAMANHKGHLPGDEMYMSGRALYPITMNLFHKLAQEFDGNLRVSYSAGADAVNLSTILACGARPVTVATDLLKPGGYSRLTHYLHRLEAEMQARGAATLDELSRDRLVALERAAAEALKNPRYKKTYHPFGLPKVETALGAFDCITAPCRHACAVCQDVPEYARYLTMGEDSLALAVILSRNPLPGVTGYVCTHLCQTRCTRNNYDEPVAIRNLKRFAAEQGHVTLLSRPLGNRRVAIIGSGPSGLAAAYYLALSGVRVTLFEARATPGGMLALAPTFRLPREVVQADIERILSLGVELELSHPVAAPPATLLDDGFDAVFVACGFPRDARLDIDGEEGQGVRPALDMLEEVARGDAPDLGERVLVIGGGNTAMDAARTAQRLTGWPVTLVYRRTRAEMPAEEEEVDAFLAEGNTFMELVSPVRILLDDGRVAALECVRNRLGKPDADGRRRPVPVAGSEFQIEADSILVAIGQRPDLTWLEQSTLTRRPNGAIQVDPTSGRAADAPIYAGGDATRGPATIIEACADGRRAAEAICRALEIPFEPLPVHFPQMTPEDLLDSKAARAQTSDQERPNLLPVGRRSGFDLVEQTLTTEAARREAARCLQCSTYCDKCVEVCPNRANVVYEVSPHHIRLPRLIVREGRLVADGSESFEILQGRQILHVADFCNECGNCATFCVHQGQPYQDKPRLFLRREDFQREQDNAFHIQGSVLWRREGGRESSLTLTGDGLLYETDVMWVQFGPNWTIQKLTQRRSDAGPISLVQAAEMAVLLQGIRATAPFLAG